MNAHTQDLRRRLSEADATIEALLSGQIDAVVDSKTKTPVLLSKAQDALRESEERYRRIVETTNEGIWTIGLDSKITFANGPLATMLGYSAEEMVGKSLLQFLPEATRAEASVRVARSRQGISEELEVRYLRKDGSELWALLKTSPIRDAEGEYVGTLAMMTDRTRHREAEEALRKSEEQYRQIVEATSDGIIKIDGNAQIVFVNRRFAEMLGYTPVEMIGTSMPSVMSAAARVTAETSEIDTTVRHRDGTEIWVNVAATRLADGVLAVVRDVTERKKLQSQLMVSDRMASVGTLAAGVAHEINNPLAAVIANLDYIADTLGFKTDAASTPKPGPCLRDEILPPLDDARDAAQRVRFIVRDLKMFSRSPSEEMKGPVDVKAIMESSVRMAWNEIRHRARLIKLYGVVPAVEGNEARLGQVFLNLLVNAAQALPEGHAEDNEIRVVTRLQGDRVIIEVSDTGAGIAPEILSRVFDAFFTTKAIGVGTGLGLAICQRIVTDMAGELTVKSELGIGTAFQVSLPIASDEQYRPPAVAAKDQAATRRGRILVIDDEIMVVRGVSRILSKNHDVIGLVAAKDALARCAAGETFDLILCDLMMPDMTGMELHRELSLVAPALANRMIFMTGGAFTAEARSFLWDTPKEHLEKPFDSANLRAIVQRYLR